MKKYVPVRFPANAPSKHMPVPVTHTPPAPDGWMLVASILSWGTDPNWGTETNYFSSITIKFAFIGIK